jgi:hypothetical protein
VAVLQARTVRRNLTHPERYQPSSTIKRTLQSRHTSPQSCLTTATPALSHHSYPRAVSPQLPQPCLTTATPALSHHSYPRAVSPQLTQSCLTTTTPALSHHNYPSMHAITNTFMGSFINPKYIQYSFINPKYIQYSFINPKHIQYSFINPKYIQFSFINQNLNFKAAISNFLGDQTKFTWKDAL